MNNTAKQLTPESLAQYFDHTLLKPFATVEDFESFCADSAKYKFKMVAINPAPVKLCKTLLEGSGVRVGAAIGFPLGQNTIETKAFETEEAIKNGSDEIDYVINITQLKCKNYSYIEREMAGIVELCKKYDRTSKVIFENCFLTDDEKKELCKIALNVGPDFIKTSTGFGTGGATLDDVALMKDMVGDKIKVKAAGGIRTLDMVLKLIDLGVERIGSTASIKIVDAFVKTL